MNKIGQNYLMSMVLNLFSCCFRIANHVLDPLKSDSLQLGIEALFVVVVVVIGV